MTRRIVVSALALLVGVSLHAQKVRGVFSLADWITNTSYLGHAGRQYIKPVPPKESTFEPASLDPCLPVRRIGDDADFIGYLLDRGLRDDALTLLGEGNYAPGDSLNWYRGLALFEDRQFLAADQWLTQVGGPLAEPALFYGNVAKIHLDRAGEALEAILRYTGDLQELAAVQNAGLALMTGDRAAFTGASARFTYADYRLTDSERALTELAGSLNRREKSPWLAAGLSAIVPGAGKIYAGKLGQGVASFLAVGSLAAITGEQWKHNGIGNWRTILAGSLCAVFYIGNIYGSWISVSIHQQEVNDETKALVIYNLTVPLHSFFR